MLIEDIIKSSIKSMKFKVSTLKNSSVRYTVTFGLLVIFGYAWRGLVGLD